MGGGRHAQLPLGHRMRHGSGYETGEQAKLLNRMFNEWMDQGVNALPFLGGKKLKEMVGHTPIEVLTGAVLGIALGFAMPMV